MPRLQTPELSALTFPGLAEAEHHELRPAQIQSGQFGWCQHAVFPHWPPRKHNKREVSLIKQVYNHEEDITGNYSRPGLAILFVLFESNLFNSRVMLSHATGEHEAEEGKCEKTHIKTPVRTRAVGCNVLF